MPLVTGGKWYPSSYDQIHAPQVVEKRLFFAWDTLLAGSLMICESRTTTDIARMETSVPDSETHNVRRVWSIFLPATE